MTDPHGKDGSPSASRAHADEPDLPKLDTLPPPSGESDAYNAPTRVGAMSPDVLDALKQAAATGRPLKPMSLPAGAPRSTPPASWPPASSRPSKPSAPPVFPPPPRTPSVHEIEVQDVIESAVPSERREGRPFPQSAPFGPVPIPTPQEVSPYPRKMVFGVVGGVGLVLLVLLLLLLFWR